MPSNEEHTPLRPCPFCGDEARHETIHDGEFEEIACSNCDYQICSSAIPYDDVVGHWNTRAGEAALVEALEALLADMMEMLASPDQLEMAAYLAKQGRPAIGEDIDGPGTITRARTALAKARSEGEGVAEYDYRRDPVNQPENM